MDNVITVYDSEAARKKHASEYNRFKNSMDILKKNKFKVDYVDCKSAADVKGDGEAQELAEIEGLKALPIAEYQGAIIAQGEYVSDQDLADFLEVPDGILSVNRSKPTPLYEEGPPLACGTGSKISKWFFDKLGQELISNIILYPKKTFFSF